MASSRAVLNTHTPFKRHKRRGKPTEADKVAVAAIVMDAGHELNRSEQLSLARTLNRSVESVRKLIAQARENFVASAEDYVDIHKAATLGALDTHDYETALKGSQWAMTNMSHEGQRIVDKPTGEAAGTKVMIGIQMGSMAGSLPTVKVAEE